MHSGPTGGAHRVVRGQRPWRVGSYLLILTLMIATASSCSASRPASSTAAAPGRSSAPAAAPAGVLATPTQTPDPAQQIAYTSEINVRVHQVDKAVGDAIKLTQSLGGFVFSQSATYQGSPQASMSLRVPPVQFRPVLSQLAALGTVLDQSVTADDVTQQVNDLGGRLKTATASADRLRGLLARAAGTSDIVAIESELEKREQEIESVQGQINALASRVNYATINVKLVERGTPKVSKNIPGFRRGLHGGWVAFINVGKALLTALGACLPFLPFVAIAFWLVVRYRRWRRAHPRPRPVRTQPWQPAVPYSAAYYPPGQAAQPPATNAPPEPSTPGEVASAPATPGPANDQGGASGT